ncbi:NrsF family protein [Bradyrhizobium sp. WSM1253]
MSVGALACALPCVGGALPSIALWYGFPTWICAAVGAKLGPSLLRW